MKRKFRFISLRVLNYWSNRFLRHLAEVACAVMWNIDDIHADASRIIQTVDRLSCQRPLFSTKHKVQLWLEFCTALCTIGQINFLRILQKKVRESPKIFMMGRWVSNPIAVRIFHTKPQMWTSWRERKSQQDCTKVLGIFLSAPGYLVQISWHPIAICWDIFQPVTQSRTEFTIEPHCWYGVKKTKLSELDWQVLSLSANSLCH